MLAKQTMAEMNSRRPLESQFVEWWERIHRARGGGC
jgi:hypothetical protein